MDETDTRVVAQLLAGVGLPTDAMEQISIRGRDPIYRTPYPIGEAAASSLAACGAAAALLWELKAGRRQSIEVDVRASAASLNSVVLQRIDGAAVRSSAWGNPLLGFYKCGDGRWFQIHGTFPHFAVGTLAVLHCAADRDQIAAAVARWEAPALEGASAERRLCGASVRTTAEWDVEEQAAAVRSLGVVQVEKIADGEPSPLPAGPQPLSGVRVLDLTRVLAGPTHGRLLAEHGADVLLLTAPHLANVPECVIDTGHGKRSAFLDLDRIEDTERLRELVRDADVFAQSFRPGALARRGCGPEDVHQVKPGAIYVSISCYGDVGVWRERPGWEQLAQTVTGLAAANGTSAGPRLLPAAVCDYITGYLAALGTMAALWRRAVEGGTFHVRASLCQTADWIVQRGPLCNADDAARLGSLDGLTDEVDTAFGRLQYLRPVVRMSETPPRLATPPVPLGTHRPEWISRQSDRGPDESEQV